MDKGLPDKLDSDGNIGLLQKYGTNPKDLRDQFGGQSPVEG